jgi:hypothetical protein
LVKNSGQSVSRRRAQNIDLKTQSKSRTEKATNYFICFRRNKKGIGKIQTRSIDDFSSTVFHFISKYSAIGTLQLTKIQRGALRQLATNFIVIVALNLVGSTC